MDVIRVDEVGRRSRDKKNLQAMLLVEIGRLHLHLAAIQASLFELYVAFHMRSSVFLSLIGYSSVWLEGARAHHMRSDCAFRFHFPAAEYNKK